MTTLDECFGLVGDEDEDEEYECPYCGRADGPWQRDHVVPYSRGGPSAGQNILLVCAECNLAKSNRLPSEWHPNPPEWILEIERAVLKTIDPNAPRPKKRGRSKKWADLTEDELDAIMANETERTIKELAELEAKEARFEAWEPGV